MNYQYFVQIVPTDIQTLIGSWPAFQYSVKEQAREVGNYAIGSSGIPGKICYVIKRSGKELVAYIYNILINFM